MMLETIFKAVSEAAVDEKLTMQQNIQLNEGETIVEYPNRILKLVSELACAGHSVSKCGKQGQIAKDCRSGDSNNKKKDETRTAMMITVQRGTLMAEASKRHSRKWKLDSGRTRHMSNQRENFSEFTSADGFIMIGNQEDMKSKGSGTIDIMAVVDGVRKQSLCNMYSRCQTCSKTWCSCLMHASATSRLSLLTARICRAREW